MDYHTRMDYHGWIKRCIWLWVTLHCAVSSLEHMTRFPDAFLTPRLQYVMLLHRWATSSRLSTRTSCPGVCETCAMQSERLARKRSSCVMTLTMCIAVLGAWSFCTSVYSSFDLTACLPWLALHALFPQASALGFVSDHTYHATPLPQRTRHHALT